MHLRQGQSTAEYMAAKDGQGMEPARLPFKVKLEKFNIRYHEGTKAAADYESIISIGGDGPANRYTVSMNRIVSHGGVRFYQSSYDEDGRGSVLAINSDPYGIPVTYVGYALLFFSLLWLLVDPRGTFRRLLRSDVLRKGALAILALMALQQPAAATTTFPRRTADHFGRMSVLYNDRIAPLQTYAYDLTKKLCGKRSYRGCTPEQVLTGFIFWGDQWTGEKIIKVKGGQLKSTLQLPDYVSVNDLFLAGDYRLKQYVEEYYHGAQDGFHQDAVELDEKVQLIMELRGGARVDDYLSGVIKKHELTRSDKEEDRMKHVRVNNANIEPVFFAYPDNEVLNSLIVRYAATAPEYDFIAPVDGFRHRFWVIADDADIVTVTEEFAKMPALYIADGHHRSAAAALVGVEKARQNPDHRGDEEYNYFMAVCFQASQLTILDYNRVVKDLNGMSSEEFLAALAKNFVVEDKGTECYKPQRLHEFSLYLDGRWYSLKAKEGTFNDADPIGVLDVDISSRLILDDLLGIKDLRSDKRIDFVGGLRGLGELKRRVDSGEMRMALALYPVSMQQIMDIADSGKIMPPKATWFEPKLRSGLVIHKL